MPGRPLYQRGGWQDPRLRDDPGFVARLREEKLKEGQTVERSERYLQHLLTREPQREFSQGTYDQLRTPTLGKRYNRTSLLRTLDRTQVDYFVGRTVNNAVLDRKLVIQREQPGTEYSGDRTTVLDRSAPEIDRLVKELTASIGDQDRVLAMPNLMSKAGVREYPMDEIQFLVTDEQGGSHRYYKLEMENPHLFGVLSSHIMELIHSGKIQLRDDEVENMRRAEAHLRGLLEQLIQHIDPSFQETGNATVRLSDVLRNSLSAIRFYPESIIPHLERMIRQDQETGVGNLAHVEFIREPEFADYTVN